MRNLFIKSVVIAIVCSATVFSPGFVQSIFAQDDIQDCVQRENQRIITQKANDSIQSFSLSNSELLSLATRDSGVVFQYCLMIDSTDNNFDRVLFGSIRFDRNDFKKLLWDRELVKKVWYYPGDTKKIVSYKIETYSVHFYRDRFGNLFIQDAKLLNIKTRKNIVAVVIFVVIASLLAIVIMKYKGKI